MCTVQYKVWTQCWIQWKGQFIHLLLFHYFEWRVTEKRKSSRICPMPLPFVRLCRFTWLLSKDRYSSLRDWRWCFSTRTKHGFRTHYFTCKFVLIWKIIYLEGFYVLRIFSYRHKPLFFLNHDYSTACFL